MPTFRKGGGYNRNDSEREQPLGIPLINDIKHMVTGRTVTCEIEQEAAENTLATARCYRQKAGRKVDLSAYMILQGLAMDWPAVSGGAGFDEENEAQIEKRGIQAVSRRPRTGARVSSVMLARTRI